MRNLLLSFPSGEQIGGTWPTKAAEPWTAEASQHPEPARVFIWLEKSTKEGDKTGTFPWLGSTSIGIVNQGRCRASTAGGVERACPGLGWWDQARQGSLLSWIERCSRQNLVTSELKYLSLIIAFHLPGLSQGLMMAGAIVFWEPLLFKFHAALFESFPSPCEATRLFQI